MLRLSKRIAVSLCVVASASAAAAAVLLIAPPFFQSAPAGVGVPFATLQLPPVVWQPGQVIPPAIANSSGFVPGVNALLNGQFVITNDREMRYVWTRLFATPYDATQFNFQNSFVILVSAGAQDIAGFGISSVEEVAANYEGGFPLPNPDVDRFLAVTSTISLPGTIPVPLPPSRYVVEAVRVQQSFFDDVVFHRNIIGGI